LWLKWPQRALSCRIIVSGFGCPCASFTRVLEPNRRWSFSTAVDRGYEEDIMGKTTRVQRLKGVSDADLAQTFEAAAATDVPPTTPPAPPVVEDLSLPQAVWPPKDDAPKARVFAKWANGVQAMFFACTKAVQDAIIRNLGVAVQAGEIETQGTSDGKAITPVSATLFETLKAKAETFLASLPIVERGPAAERVKEALGFILLMRDKNPGLDLSAEQAQAELAEKRVKANFFKDGVDFKPAVEQAEEAATSASRVTEDFLIGQLRDKADAAGQDPAAVEAFITDEVSALAEPSHRRFKLIGRIRDLDQLARPAYTPRLPVVGKRRPGDQRARFTRRG